MTMGAARYVPNVITFMRVPFTCLMVYFILQGEYLSAVLVFTVICFTDFSDGFVARALGASTQFGGYFDVAADLFYVILTLVVLNIESLAPPWFTVLVTLKFVEFAVTSSILKPDIENKSPWVFDDLGRCFSVLAFISPGIFSLAALLQGNTEYIVFSVLILASILAVTSSVSRITRCVHSTKRISDRSVLGGKGYEI